MSWAWYYAADCCREEYRLEVKNAWSHGSGICLNCGCQVQAKVDSEAVYGSI